MTIITRNLITRMAKSVKGDMKHTQKLDAFAAVLGYPDQTAMMGDLKTKEEAIAAAAKAAASFPEKKPAEKDLDDMIRETLTAWLAQHDGSDLDPFPRSDWRQDVDNGDTQQGYEDWREAQVEQYLAECALESLLEAYASGITKNGVYLGPEGPLDYSLSHAVDRFRSVGGEAVFGDEAMEILEEILEEVESGSEETFTKRDEYRRNDVSRFRARVKEAWEEQNSTAAKEAARQDGAKMVADQDLHAFLTRTGQDINSLSLDQMLCAALQAFFDRTEEEEHDPFTRREWGKAVSRGDVIRSGYQDWRLSQSEQFLDECGLEDILASYLTLPRKDGVVMDDNLPLSETIDHALSHYEPIYLDVLFGKDFEAILESIQTQATENSYKSDAERRVDVEKIVWMIWEEWLRTKSA